MSATEFSTTDDPFRSHHSDTTPSDTPAFSRGVTHVLRFISSLPRVLFVGLIRVYQTLISPMTGPSCRFYPSCSQYAITALQTHGLLRGMWLAVRRLCRCHPWNPGGVDHVPPRRGTSPESSVKPVNPVSERND